MEKGIRITMRISVAMATYNGAVFIREQLDSIIANLSNDDEIIISDDGSTDDTRCIVEEYARKYPFIRLVEGPGEGVISNFEYAINICEGKYIFLADQDDVWKPDKVRKVLEAFEKQNCCLVIHDAEVVNENLSSTIMDSFFDYRDSRPGVLANLIKNRYMGCCMAFRRELVKDILPIPKSIPMHDQWIGLVSDSLNGKSCFLQEKLLLYRRHECAVSDFDHNSVGVMLRNRWVIYHYLRDRMRTIRKERKL